MLSAMGDTLRIHYTVRNPDRSDMEERWRQAAPPCVCFPTSRPADGVHGCCLCGTVCPRHVCTHTMDGLTHRDGTSAEVSSCASTGQIAPWRLRGVCVLKLDLSDDDDDYVVRERFAPVVHGAVGRCNTSAVTARRGAPLHAAALHMGAAGSCALYSGLTLTQCTLSHQALSRSMSKSVHDDRNNNKVQRNLPSLILMWEKKGIE